MSSIFEQLMNEFRGDTLSRLATSLGESPARLQTALAGVVPALLGGLSKKASTTEGSTELLNLIKQNSLDTAQYANASTAVASPGGITNLINAGKPLLDSILGGRSNSVTDWVASYAGVNRASSASLLSLAAPITLGMIGRQVSSTGWNPSNLMNLLGGRKTLLDAPAGLASVLGFGSVTAATRQAAEMTPDETTLRHGSSGWKWLLALLLILPLGYLLFRAMQPPTRNVVQPTASFRADLGAFMDRVLPHGATLHIPSNGVESKLLSYIEDPGRTDETWFSFDRLEFESDAATLKASSAEQLRNISEILKAYPLVNVKIGGYTDNVGNPEYNLNLSQARATNTMNDIVSMGIERSRLEAEGYGEQFPVSDNSTDEGRQRNRRIDIKVTKK